MVRTQVQLTEEQAAALKRIAAERGVSMSEVVREGVRMVIEGAHGRIVDMAPGLTREERRRRALSFRTFEGPSDLSERHDDYFVESVIDPVKE